MRFLQCQRCPTHAVGYVETCQKQITFNELADELPASLRFAALIDQDIRISAHLSGAAIELLKGLLDVRPWARLAPGSTQDLSCLEFFETFDWDVSQSEFGRRCRRVQLCNATTNNLSICRLSRREILAASLLPSFLILRWAIATALRRTFSIRWGFIQR